MKTWNAVALSCAAWTLIAFPTQAGKPPIWGIPTIYGDLVQVSHMGLAGTEAIIVPGAGGFFITIRVPFAADRYGCGCSGNGRAASAGRSRHRGSRATG